MGLGRLMALFGCFSLRAQLSKDLFYPFLLLISSLVFIYIIPEKK